METVKINPILKYEWEIMKTVKVYEITTYGWQCLECETFNESVVSLTCNDIVSCEGCGQEYVPEEG